jgi:hypothetical protein
MLDHAPTARRAPLRVGSLPLALALLAVALPALAQQVAPEDDPYTSNKITSMDEAIAYYDRGKTLTGQVATDLAIEAASLAEECSPSLLPAYIAIARGGGQTGEVVAALMDRYAANPSGQAFVAAEVHRIGRDATVAAARANPAWAEHLGAAIDAAPGAPPPFLVALYAWHAPGDALGRLLGEWAERRPPPHLLGHLVQHMGQAQDAPGAFAALVAQPLPHRLLPKQDLALRQLMPRRGVYGRLTKLLRDGQTSPGLYRALGHVPAERAKGVEPFLLRRLKREQGENLEALIAACAELRLAKALPAVIDAASGGGGPTRATALGAIPRLLKAVRRRADREALESHAKSAVRGALGEQEDGEVLAAALNAALSLGLYDELDQETLLEIAQDERMDPAGRRKAIMVAAAQAPAKDLRTLEVLVPLLRDRAVLHQAYTALTRVAGVRLPKRPAAWERWLERHRSRRGK